MISSPVTYSYLGDELIRRRRRRLLCKFIDLTHVSYFNRTRKELWRLWEPTHTPTQHSDHNDNSLCQLVFCNNFDLPTTWRVEPIQAKTLISHSLQRNKASLGSRHNDRWSFVNWHRCQNDQSLTRLICQNFWANFTISRSADSLSYRSLREHKNTKLSLFVSRLSLSVDIFGDGVTRCRCHLKAGWNAGEFESFVFV